jgi:hypothetical protein
MADPAFSDVATARPNYSFRLSLSESRAAELDESVILCIRRSCTSSFYPQASVIFLQSFASESYSYIYTHIFESSISYLYLDELGSRKPQVVTQTESYGECS